MGTPQSLLCGERRSKGVGGVFALWRKQSLTDFATTRRLLVAHPTVAVPDKIIGLTLFLDFIDRCHSLASFLPPQAAVGSLPPRDNLLLIKNYKKPLSVLFLTEKVYNITGRSP